METMLHVGMNFTSVFCALTLMANFINCVDREISLQNWGLWSAPT
jgi:hypothetical protein